MSSSRIALLAMSSAATALYRQLWAVEYPDRSDLREIAVDFDEINELLPHPSEELRAILHSYLEQVETGLLIVPNITIHETLDLLCAEMQYPFRLIHPIEAVIHRLVNNAAESVMILGTYYTMQRGYISRQLEESGISCYFPELEMVEQIDSYRRSIYDGTAAVTDVSTLTDIIASYARQRPVILACTELSLIYDGHTPRVYDLVRVQIESVRDRL